MSLNWNIAKVENKDEVCYTEAKADQPMRGIKAGDRIMDPVTDTLIWATIVVGIGSITESSAPEFYARLSLYEKVFGSFLTSYDEDGKQVRHPITREQVRQHIGLSTNVSKESRAVWRKRMIDRELDDTAKRYVEFTEREAVEA